MGVTQAYDVERLTPAGPVLEHHEGAISTDGVWLILTPPGSPDMPSLIVPAGAVIAAKPCEGRCRSGGE